MTVEIAEPTEQEIADINTVCGFPRAYAPGGTVCSYQSTGGAFRLHHTADMANPERRAMVPKQRLRALEERIAGPLGVR